MGIEIRNVGRGGDIFGTEGTAYAPVIVCDHCGERIEAADHGAYVWGSRFLDNGTEVMTAIMYFHKRYISDECAAAWTAHEDDLGQRGFKVSWMELRHFPIIMTHTLGITASDGGV